MLIVCMYASQINENIENKKKKTKNIKNRLSTAMF